MGTNNFKFNANQLSNKITDILNEEYINKTAKECGFIVRKGKIDGFKFLDMLLFTHFNQKELSLNDLALQLEQRYKISITKQGIDERFTEAAVKFFKIVLEEVINISIQKNTEIDFTQYDKVRIKDSTAFQLPDSMQDKYPGSGGAGSKASIRIQFEYDIKTGKILDLSLYAFNNQDANNAKTTIEEIQSNELVIRDLGYVLIDNLKKINNKGAFYLNRLHKNTKVYKLNDKGIFEEIDFSEIYKYMKTNQLSRIDKEVYIGKEKFKTRIIIELLPKKQYEERIRKAKKEATKKGRELGKDYKAKAGLNIFITNTEIDAEQIRLLYTIRWQIELMFKIWKSIGEIDKVKKMKIERFESFLIAKLIWIAINWQIMWNIILYFYNVRNQKISPYKLFKTLKIRLIEFRTALYNGSEHLTDFINNIAKISPVNHKSEKKKNSKNWSYEIFKTFSIKYNVQIINMINR